MALAELQREFTAALVDPTRPLPSGLAGRSRSDAACFAVYRNNVAVGLINALAGRFPVTARLVGDAFFRGMARAFSDDVKPTLPMMSAYGDGFPDFIAGFPPAAGLPYLADVARLEALRTRAYHAADTGVLTPDHLTAIAAADPTGTRLLPHPAAAIVTSQHPIASIWDAHQRVPVVQDFIWRAETVLVARPAGAVSVQVLPVDRAGFAAALLGGATLGAAAEAAFATHPDFEFGAALIDLAALGAFAAPLERNGP